MSNKGKTAVIIPARFASSRFPGKLLADLHGRPVIQQVYDQALKTSADAVWVAADDKRIADAVEAFGGNAVMTSSSHPSGTDRIHEAAEILAERGMDFDLIVNIQGDEPLISPEVVDKLIAMMSAPDSPGMGTVAVNADRDMIADDPNRVKAVVAADGTALYFTRASAPFLREGGEDCGMLLHWGLYAYTREVLARLVAFPESPLEKCEKLEQLRALENGISIKVLVTDKTTVGIDTPEDLEIVRKMLA